MRPILALLSVLPLACVSKAAAIPEAAPLPGGEHFVRGEEILRHATFLSSDEMGGRPATMSGGQAAAEYIARELEQAGLVPVSRDDGFFSSIGEGFSPNVVGMVPGSSDAIYMITAHYDHLPPHPADAGGEDRIFNGADDNASGTASLIVLARAFASVADQLDASVVFAAFTAEEMGLRGSRHFVEEPPFPLERLRGVINLDMIGRGEDDLIFCEGGPKAPALAGAIERANATIGLRIQWDQHPEWIPASDHFPFMQAGIPALYLGVEDHPDYHRVSDHADKLLPLLMERVARLSYGALLELGSKKEALD